MCSLEFYFGFMQVDFFFVFKLSSSFFSMIFKCCRGIGPRSSLYIYIYIYIGPKAQAEDKGSSKEG